MFISQQGASICSVPYTSQELMELASFSTMSSNVSKQRNLKEILEHFSLLMPLLNRTPSVVFFVKDNEARYVMANRTLVARLHLNSFDDIVGKTALDLFEASFGQSYYNQDVQVLSEGVEIFEQLELHYYRSGASGWCITHKLPLYGGEEQPLIGMIGVSIDIQTDEAIKSEVNDRIWNVVQYIQTNYSRSVHAEELSAIAQLSTSQLDRTFKNLFRMTPNQYIQKIRLEHAIELLKSDSSLTEIAMSCGYSDHSAFSRQFKQMTGLTPSQFRHYAKKHRVELR